MHRYTTEGFRGLPVGPDEDPDDVHGLSASLIPLLKADRQQSTQPSRSEAPANATGAGRKRNDRFGEDGPEKQTASYRPNPAIRDIFARPLKQTAAGPT